MTTDEEKKEKHRLYQKKWRANNKIIIKNLMKKWLNIIKYII